MNTPVTRGLDGEKRDTYDSGQCQYVPLDLIYVQREHFEDLNKNDGRMECPYDCTISGMKLRLQSHKHSRDEED